LTTTIPSQATAATPELRLDAAIRRVVTQVAAEYPGLPNAWVLALIRAQLLEEPAARAEIFAALLALTGVGVGPGGSGGGAPWHPPDGPDF
jgi:hypothetical protein